MTEDQKQPCVPKCRKDTTGWTPVGYTVIHAPNCPNAPAAPKAEQDTCENHYSGARYQTCAEADLSFALSGAWQANHPAKPAPAAPKVKRLAELEKEVAQIDPATWDQDDAAPAPPKAECHPWCRNGMHDHYCPHAHKPGNKCMRWCEVDAPAPAEVDFEAADQWARTPGEDDVDGDTNLNRCYIALRTAQEQLAAKDQEIAKLRDFIKDMEYQVHGDLTRHSDQFNRRRAAEFALDDLRAQLAAEKAAREADDAFHRATVQQRDAAWARVKELQEESDARLMAFYTLWDLADRTVGGDISETAFVDGRTKIMATLAARQEEKSRG